MRADISPELRWSSAGAGYFFEPVVGYHFTQYDLQNAARRRSEHPTRALPYASVDTGLVFERDSGSQGQRTRRSSRASSTATFPTAIRTSCRFSTPGCPDLNLIELFRTNRYVGEDRIGDANSWRWG